MAVANEYQGKPVCFIAVNSGNNTKEVSSYLKSHKVSWPTIVDTKREVEKAIIKGQISTSNIWQFRTIDGEGNLKRAGGDLKAEIDKALSTASWNVDPASIPDSLQQAWQSVEFGDFPAAAKMVNAAMKSRDEEIKTGAKVLNDFVQSELAEPLASAAALKEDEEKAWDAYKAYSMLEKQFKGYLDDSVNTKKILRELKSTDQVKLELSAMRQLETASNDAARFGFKKAMGRLKKIISKYPDTEAAATAEKLLSENGAE